MMILFENKKGVDFDVSDFLAKEEEIQDILMSDFWLACDEVLKVSSGDVGIHELEENLFASDYLGPRPSYAMATLIGAGLSVTM